MACTRIKPDMKSWRRWQRPGARKPSRNLFPDPVGQRRGKGFERRCELAERFWTRARIAAEEFDQEALHRSGGARIRIGVIRDTRAVRSGVVCETMHCTAVDDQVPVGAG